MSRMTKFLKQTCLFERATRNEYNEIQLDKFGVIHYEDPVEIKCRREKIFKSVQISNGSILQSSIRYFIDDSVLIEVNDKLDNKVILEVEEYINNLGQVEGYEVYV